MRDFGMVHTAASKSTSSQVGWISSLLRTSIGRIMRGMALLPAFTNRLCALLTLASLLGYAVDYSMFLKHATPQNIVIGGAAGAAPPLLGWVAVTGHVDGGALLLS